MCFNKAMEMSLTLDREIRQKNGDNYLTFLWGYI